MGMDTPKIEITIPHKSKTEFCFKAEIIPKGIPNKTANTIPQTASKNVFSILGPI